MSVRLYVCLKDGKNEESKAKVGLLILGNYEWYGSLLALTLMRLLASISL